MKTKNRSEEEKSAGGVVKAAAAKAVAKSTKAKGEPKMEEKAGNWFGENWVNVNPVEVKNATAKNAVYIANSENSVFKIDNKVKTVTVDNCKKCSIIVDTCISSIELVNSE